MASQAKRMGDIIKGGIMETVYQEQVDKVKATITQGQSGKLGFEVRVYAKTVDEAIASAADAAKKLQIKLKELE